MNIFLITQEDGKYTLIKHDKVNDICETLYNLGKGEVYALVSVLMDSMMQEV